jgi:hypothetical protein
MTVTGLRLELLLTSRTSGDDIMAVIHETSANTSAPLSPSRI